MNLHVDIECVTSAASDCFVALPPSLAVALHRDEDIHLLVLRLERHAGDVIGLKTLYVAWDGGASKDDHSLQVHPSFAEAIGLRHRERISITAVPAYHAPHGTSVSLQVHSPEDYAALTTAADFLESTLLNQVRVLCDDLKFPVRLPGHGSALLKVSNISVPSMTSYSGHIVLNSDVKVIVMAPEVRNLSHMTCTGVADSLQLRAMPHRLLESMNLTISCTDMENWIGSDSAFELNVNIRRTPPDDCIKRTVTTKLCSQSCDSIPTGHVAIPEHIWIELGLVPFVNVTVDALSRACLRRAPKVLRFSRLVSGSESDLKLDSCRRKYSEHDLTRLFRLPSVVFAGMVVGNWVLLPDDPSDDDAANDSFRRTIENIFAHTEPWDTENTEDSQLNSSLAKGISRVNASEDAPTSSTLHAEAEYWETDGQETLRFEGVTCIRPNDMCNYNVFCACSERSMDHSSVFSDLRGPGYRDVVRDILRRITPQRSPNVSFPRVVLLRGTKHSGKTSISLAVSRYLCCFQSYRTIWVRWRTHSRDSLDVVLKRLAKAFEVARTAGPNILVFDDLDAVAARSERGHRCNDEAGDGASQDKNRRAYALARAIIAGLRKCEATMTGVILTCHSDSVLDEELRVPGFIAHVVDVPSPKEEDRLAILASALCQIMGIEIHKLDPADEARTGVCEAAKLAEGYTPRDLRSVVEVLVVSSDAKSLRHHTIVDAVRGFVPRNQVGIVHGSPPVANAECWNHVGGLGNAKMELRDALELPTQYPALFASAPIRMQSGILLHGPPGCGKTLLAKAAVQALGLKSIFVKGPEVLSKYIGESEAEVRRLFQRASLLTPCAIVFDEFDALAPRRGGESTGVADRVVNTLLTALDGVEGLKRGVFVLVTSSRPELIDPALLRPGRIDRWIPVSFPSLEERVEIVDIICRSANFEQGIDVQVFEQVAECTEGFSGADLRGVVVEAGIAISEAEFGDEASTREKHAKNLVAAARSARPSLSSHERNRFEYVMQQFSKETGPNYGEVSLRQEDFMKGKSAVHVALR